MRTWICGICFFMVITPVAAQTESARPVLGENSNILFFFVDDMGWQNTSEPFWTKRTPLNEKYHTPNMEELARQGMKFTQAYACAVCSPSRISLMTGMNAARRVLPPHRAAEHSARFKGPPGGLSQSLAATRAEELRNTRKARQWQKN